MNLIQPIRLSKMTPYLKYPDVRRSQPYVDYPGSGKKWGEYKMMLALLDPDTPAIMRELDGAELNFGQAIVAEAVERHDDYCCWFYELTAGVLDNNCVSPGKDNFVCERAFFESMLLEDAEDLIDLVLEVKIKIKNHSARKIVCRRE